MIQRGGFSGSHSTMNELASDSRLVSFVNDG